MVAVIVMFLMKMVDSTHAIFYPIAIPGLIVQKVTIFELKVLENHVLTNFRVVFLTFSILGKIWSFEVFFGRKRDFKSCLGQNMSFWA